MSNADRDSYLRDAPPARSRARDLVIVASMALVSLAFGAALLVNGGFGFGPSIIGGLGLFVLSMFIHSMMRRLQALSQDRIAETVSLEEARAALGQEPVMPVSRGARTPGAPAVAATAGAEEDGEHGWGEPAAVNDLVRQLATELQRAPDAGPAAASRAAPPSPTVPRGEAARPMPAPARPLGAELAPSAAERAPARPMTPRPSAPAPREDLTDIVVRAVETDDLEIHLQPVMTLSDRRAQLYEAFPRLRDGQGNLLKPEVYHRAAAEAGLTTDIERLVFRRTVQILRRLIERGKQRPMFCPLSVDSLRDGTFLRAFHETLKAGPALAANLVFDFSEAGLARLGPAERDAIHALANAGFRFSVKDVVQLDMTAIGDLPIGFVKLLPIALTGQPGHAAGMVARVRSIGAEPIIDGVHDERDVAVAQALGIVLGQGGFLSEPRPLKAEVIGEARTGT